MLEQISKTIEALKQRVKRNLDIIHANEKIVRVILNEPLSKSRSERLEKKYNENKALLKENNDSIQLQLQLSKYLEAYKNELKKADNQENTNESQNPEKESMPTREEFFEMTIKNEISFSPSHPYYDDEDFFNQLLEYYKSIEDYETCSILVKNRPSNAQ
jgi:hypothetical protein